MTLRHRSAALDRPVRLIVATSTATVLVSLTAAWFTFPWPGNYEFYSGTEGAFAARGYPVQIVVHLIIPTSLGILICLVVGGSRRVSELLAPRGARALQARVLVGAAAVNVTLVLLALTFPPRDMVRFPTAVLCPGIYVALAGAGAAFLGATLLLGLGPPEIAPDAVSRGAARAFPWAMANAPVGSHSDRRGGHHRPLRQADDP